MVTITSTFTPLQVDDSITIAELITKYNPDHVLPDKIVYEDTISGTKLTYGGLRNDAARCTWGLQQQGLKEGDVVCIIVPNSTDFVLLAYSVWWAAATFSPLNPLYSLNALWISSISKGKKFPQIFTVLDRNNDFDLFPEDIIGKTAEHSILPYSLADTDRLKEMIKYKGFQVAPSELEYLLLQHPEVSDAAVCAVYENSQATEVPLAYVSLSSELVQWDESKKAGVPEAINLG